MASIFAHRGGGGDIVGGGAAVSATGGGALRGAHLSRPKETGRLRPQPAHPLSRLRERAGVRVRPRAARRRQPPRFAPSARTPLLLLLDLDQLDLAGARQFAHRAHQIALRRLAFAVADIGVLPDLALQPLAEAL